MKRNPFPHEKTDFNLYKRVTKLAKYNISLALLLVFIIFSPRSAIADLAIDTIVNQVSKNDYISYVQTLEGYGTRSYGTPGNTNAINFISSTFNSFNLNVIQNPFTYSSNTYYNVVATLPGATHPDNVYIVGAHFDSVSAGPGADDNASGMAAVLEIASVLSQYSFQSTIKFIGFNVEEQGLVGSHTYSDEAEVNGDKVLGMLNFDMIAYTGSNPNEDVDIFGDNWLVDLMVANAVQYTPSLNIEAHYGNTYGSDHYYFHSSLYPGSASLLAIENTPSEIWGGANPYYHTANDTSDKLNFDFATDITRTGIATLAGLAQTIPEPATIYCLSVGLFIIGWTRYRRHSHCTVGKSRVAV